jgi:glycosyltransferase involved in cell wall biosynthesis
MIVPRIAMITNIPSPYREGMHILLNEKFRNNYHVFYCAMSEPNRLWIIGNSTYNKTYLKRSVINFKNRSIYLNTDIIKELNNYNPDVIITAGFSPTMLLSFLWSKFHGKKHIAFTDGTVDSEKSLGKIHRWVRKFVYRYTHGFIGASKKSLELYVSYNVSNEKMFLSPICINNELYRQARGVEKKYDIIYSGQFIDRKMPFFFIDVIKLINDSLPCKVILIGSGELKEKMLNRLEELNIDYSYPGYIQQEQLPLIYGSAKILLFPTKFDAWGITANEACAAGIPVITCENAGAANELIINDYNGYVLPLDEKIWAQHVVKVLSDSSIYKNLSDNAVISVSNYNYEKSVNGILNAVDFVTN